MPRIISATAVVLLAAVAIVAVGVYTLLVVGSRPAVRYYYGDGPGARTPGQR